MHTDDELAADGRPVVLQSSSILHFPKPINSRACRPADTPVGKPADTPADRPSAAACIAPAARALPSAAAQVEPAARNTAGRSCSCRDYHPRTAGDCNSNRQRESRQPKRGRRRTTISCDRFWVQDGKVPSTHCHAPASVRWRRVEHQASTVKAEAAGRKRAAWSWRRSILHQVGGSR